MPRYALVIDLNRCIGCHTCAVACRAAWNVAPPHGRCRIQRLGPATTPDGLAHTFYPVQCGHCDRPACVPVCPVDKREIVVTAPDGMDSRSLSVSATWKDPFTGIVHINAERCIGCGSCVEACPYEARFLYRSGTGPRADACSFCIERLQAGEAQPVCVGKCLTGARIFGDLDDVGSAVARHVARGAVRLETASAQPGINIFFAGRKRDIQLLRRLAAPGEKAAPSTRRRLLSLLVR